VRDKDFASGRDAGGLLLNDEWVYDVSRHK